MALECKPYPLADSKNTTTNREKQLTHKQNNNFKNKKLIKESITGPVIYFYFFFSQSLNRMRTKKNNKNELKSQLIVFVCLQSVAAALVLC